MAGSRREAMEIVINGIIEDREFRRRVLRDPVPEINRVLRGEGFELTRRDSAQLRMLRTIWGDERRMLRLARDITPWGMWMGRRRRRRR